MKKLITVFLFIFVSYVNVVYAAENILCQNMQTTTEECKKIAKKMYDKDNENIYNLYVKYKRGRGETPVSMQEAKAVNERQLPFDVYFSAFQECGETTNDYNNAMACLNYTTMIRRKK